MLLNRKSEIDVAIVGGGIAGLTSGYLLSKAGYRVVVFEREKETGGNIRSKKISGYIIERGPYCFMKSSRWVWKLCREAGIEDYLIGASAVSNRRFIFRDGRLRVVPLNPVSLLGSSLLSFQAKCEIFCEPFKKGGAKEFETSYEFFVRRFGREFADYVASAFVSGIYAGDIKKIGARAAFSRFWEFEKLYGSMIRGSFYHSLQVRGQLRQMGIKPRKGLWSFTGGLGFITEVLSNFLDGSLMCSSEVTGIKKCGDGSKKEVRFKGGVVHAARVIVATPPYDAALILKEGWPEASSIFSSIPMVPVVVAQWTFRRGNRYEIPRGFGYIIPPLYRTDSMGTIFYSDIFPHFSPDGLAGIYGTFLGGAFSPWIVELDEGEIEKRVIAELEYVFGYKHNFLSIRFVNIVKHRMGISQLLPDHPERIARAREILEKDGVYVAGGYLTGVGMDHAVASGYDVYRKITGYYYG